MVSGCVGFWPPLQLAKPTLGIFLAGFLLVAAEPQLVGAADLLSHAVPCGPAHGGVLLVGTLIDELFLQAGPFCRV